MKKLLCFSMVFILVVLLAVPCFAAETTVDRGDPVDWFGGGTYVSSYTVTVTDLSYSDLSFQSWLTAIGAVDADHAVGSYTYRIGSNTYSGQLVYVSGGNLIFGSSGDGWGTISSSFSGSSTIFSDVGLSEAQSISGVTVTTTESGSNGFVDGGVSDALSELSIIVSAILSNQYVLIAIGLAVAVPLVAWGISKIKSLVKGY